MGIKNIDFSKFKLNKNLRKQMFQVLILVLLYFFLFILVGFCVRDFTINNRFEKSMVSYAEAFSKNIFSIDHIHLFSSATAENSSTTDAWNLAIHQYTDIAVYVNNHADSGFTSENTVKELKITNMKFNSEVSGKPNLFYKNVYNFGKYFKDENNLIKDNLNYKVVKPGDEISYDAPEIFENLSNPITFGYINSDIKKDYQYSGSSITFNGSVLEDCKVALEDIQNTVSFTIEITNNLDEHFKSNVYVEIPLTTTTDSIYEGKIIQNLNKDNMFRFYKI